MYNRPTYNKLCSILKTVEIIFPPAEEPEVATDAVRTMADANASEINEMLRLKCFLSIHSKRYPL